MGLWTRARQWHVCGRGICLYDGNAVDRMPHDPQRCIKHGEILESVPQFDGLTREQARERLDAE